MFTLFDIIGKDKIEKLRQEYEKEQRIAVEHAQKAKDIKQEIINSVFDEYIDQDERDKLIKDAKAFSFSNKKIEQIENAFKDYDQDKITYNVASDIMDARKHIKEHKKESFFSTISNIVINEDD